MLEPLSAFSLACNVIQIVETGCKLLAAAADYRQAGDGALKEHRELREVSRTLNNLSTSLKSSFQSPVSSPLPAEETRLLQANEECLRLSQDFIGLLDHLKVKDRHATFESLRMSIKARWYKDRMDAMQKAMSEARDNLNIAFLIYMHAQQSAASSQTEDSIANSAAQVQQSILIAVNATSGSIQQEIKDLAERLKETYLDADDQTAVGFLSANEEALHQISNQLNSIATMQEHRHTAKDGDRNLAAQEKILDGLQFGQMNDRREQIHEAHDETYRWMLQSLPSGQRRWDCFHTWLTSSSTDQHIYWVHGKAGSGKSTMLKFLHDNIAVDRHLSPWADGCTVLRAVCFFWTPGSTLQKSLSGLYRSVLFQILDQAPDLMSEVVPSRRWKAAQVHGTQTMEWTESELRNAIKACIEKARPETKVLFLIDGLDEFEGTDEQREDLIDYLVGLSRYGNLKLCLSSRPWNIYREAFQHFPQLKLDDLTYNDIKTYVVSKLQSHRLFQYIGRQDPEQAELLCVSIITKAAGVFLWVRLVVRDILRCLRDGDGLEQLRRRLDYIPADLDEYFVRMIDSIEPEHRREASVLLQLAMHKEDYFTTVHPLRLIDISFVGEQHEDFATRPGYNFGCLNLLDRDSVLARISSTLRKLNSRCMGMLECVYDSSNRFSKNLNLDINDRAASLDKTYGATRLLGSSRYQWRVSEDELDVSFQLKGARATELQDIVDLKVKFLHRSLHDFLLTPNMQAYLRRYTDGALNARKFICNARLVEFMALTSAGIGDELAVGLASYLLSALSVNHESRHSAVVAEIMQPAMDRLAQDHVSSRIAALYIDASLMAGLSEVGNFLTLAIDFDLTSYVLANLTPESVSKEGRPLLDYILRPRFATASGDLDVNNRWPNVEVLDAALQCGANPNESFGGVSLWALFLCFCADTLDAVDHGRHYQEMQNAYYQTLLSMIKAGARPMLPRSSLESLVPFVSYGYSDDRESHVERFHRRWTKALPSRVNDLSQGNEPLYAVSDLLEDFVGFFEFSIEPLVQELRSREPARTRLPTEPLFFEIPVAMDLH